MIEKRLCRCTARDEMVEAVVEITGRGSKQSHNFLICNNSHECEGRLECRFSNPLTTGVPLELVEEAEAKSAAS